MSTDIAVRAGTDLAAPAADPYLAYGSAVTQQRLVGDMLKFTKGDFVYGQDAIELPAGTRLIANMENLLIGWIRWENNRPEEQLMGLISDGFRPARRSDLGYTDESVWPKDKEGRPQDPWQESNYLLMKDPETDKLFTFVTASTGGRSAIGELCKTYGKERRMRPDQFPIVAISTGKYKHSNATFGWVKYPKFDIVGWVSKSVFDDPTAASDADDDIPFELPPAAPKGNGKAAVATRF